MSFFYFESAEAESVAHVINQCIIVSKHSNSGLGFWWNDIAPNAKVARMGGFLSRVSELTSAWSNFDE